MLNETSTPNAMGDFVMDTTSPQGGNTPRGYALSIHKPDPSIVGGFAMASTTPFPNTPGAYVSVKTPEGHASDHDINAGVSAWSTRFRWAGNGAQIMVFLTMALYIIGLIGYYTKFFDVTMTDEIKKWLRVPADQVTGYGAPTEDFKGHPEMLIPIYFMIFNVLPVFLGVLLIEFLRHYNVRRISSQYMLKVAMVLRRKPALFGKVSYWTYGEWIFFWGLVGANLLVYIVPYLKRVARTKAFYERPLEFTESLELISVTFGFSCIFNLSLLFLPATRNSAWMEFFNISYANGIKYHRWLGVLTVLTGSLHCIGYYSYWIRMGMWKKMALPCFNCNLGDEAGRLAWIAVFGQLALLIFLIIGLTSIPYVRRKFYNVFYYSHQLLFLAVVFAVMHWPTIIWWIFPTFVVYCYGRARSMTSNISPIEVQELTAIHDDVVKVVLKRSPGRDGYYRVGQFLYLNVPAISKLQWHAFTIASSPKTSSTTLTVLIKSLGDWTKDLVAHANECKEKSVLPTIYVDGFHGASLEMYDEYSTILLVGGGIGATPLIAILEDIAAKLAAHKSLRQRVVFAFSFRELALLEEIHPVLVRLRELDPRELYFKTQFYLTRLPSEDIMARLVDTSRLRRKHSVATTYKPSLMAPIALSETLRSRTYRALAFTTVVVVGLLALVYLEYGNPTGKIVRKGKQYWPLQGFVNAVVVMVLSMGIVFVYVFAERLSKLKMLALNTTAASKEVELNLFQSLETPALTVSDVHTYYDLLSHYKVVLGERPDVNAIVAEAFEFHSDPAVPSEGKPVIGVFVSGPDAMKRAVEYAVQELGVSHFDIHEEEFEL